MLSLSQGQELDIAHSRDLVNVVKDGLLESGGQGAEGLDGVLDSLLDFLMLQGLVIGHIIW